MLSAHLRKINQIHCILHSRRPPTGFPQLALGKYFSSYSGFGTNILRKSQNLNVHTNVYAHTIKIFFLVLPINI